MVSSENSVKIIAAFKAGMYGTFKEWVVFEFTSGQRLVRKLRVDVGSSCNYDKLCAVRKRLDSPRWTEKNALIKWCPETAAQITEKQTCSGDDIASMSMFDCALSRGNYIQQMRRFIKLEEAKREELMAR